MTPDELRSLMRYSILRTSSLQNVPTDNTPVLVSLRITPDEGYDANDRRIPVYSLKRLDQNAASGFSAYVCNYQQGQIKYAFLGNAAPFMFTITMNGCTFGIGVPNGNGGVVVCHGNRAVGKQKNPQEQAAEQLTQVRDLLTEQTGQAPSMVLRPEQYRTTGKQNSTTFGIRENGAWKFYMHRYENIGLGEKGAKYKLLGTKEIVGNEFAFNAL